MSVDDKDGNNASIIIVGKPTDYIRLCLLDCSDWETEDTCSSLLNYDVEQVECDLLLSYVCERGELGT